MQPEDDEEGIEEQDLEGLIVANESFETAPTGTESILTVSYRTPITVPERGEELTARKSSST
jgi:hypothetical protein